MNIKILFVLALVLYACGNAPESECLSEINEKLITSVNKKFETKDVVIQTKRLKEEIYFPKIDAVVLTISDATLKEIDFKKNPVIENYEEVESYLKSESRFLESELLSKCNFNDFDEIIVEYGRRNTNSEFIHWFVIHFEINPN